MNVVTKSAGKSYSLIAPISAEYERHRKPIPSGFAKVRLTLEPGAETLDLKLVTKVNIDDRSWQLLEAHSATTNEVLEISREIEEGFRKEAILGINEGAEAALESYLDAPVRRVKIVINEVAFHPVYSTIMAFKIASQKAIESALDKAHQQGLLVTVSND